ncbi:MAGUK p55 subfamily member 5 [Nymphon striatum]|nr:MAGUK p55 subfamily member 5 [Nymphon striatum]
MSLCHFLVRKYSFPGVSVLSLVRCSISTIRSVSSPTTHERNVNYAQMIEKYAKEDLKKRKEEEDRVAREEEFLRSSLRGSRKLQALETHPPLVPPSGVVNTAFLSDDGEEPLNSESQTNNNKSTLTAPIGPEELQEVLQRVQIQLNNNGYHDDLVAVDDLLNNPDFQKILCIHKKIQEIWCFSTPPSPLYTNAQDLIQKFDLALYEGTDVLQCVIEHFHQPATLFMLSYPNKDFLRALIFVLNNLQESTLPEATELIEILSKFEFEGLIYTHDKIAERHTVLPLQGDEDILDRVSQYTDDSIKIVRIDKTNEPLGATVRNEGEAVVIGRIVKGGAAEKSGKSLLHEGDEILEVNGIEMRGKSVNEATMMGTLTFIVIPTQNERPQTPARDTVKMYLSPKSTFPTDDIYPAHFDYEPDDDLYNPCRELGISFQKGDILHVINQDDANWWQAYREGEEDQTLADDKVFILKLWMSLFQEFSDSRHVYDAYEKENVLPLFLPSMKQTIVGDINNKEKSKKDADSEEILTYEEVALYYPRANRKRPIVLIGPPNIGRHELRQKLMEDIQRFAAAIPHTSRQKKDGELDGQDYHFITRPQFESDIVSRKFVEHGEFEKNYYGTSINAIRSVVNSSKICVLNLHPQSLKILKNSDLKPYVVFVAPPSLEKLRQNRAKMGANVKDDELKDIIEKAREMEENYGHYFDMIIINSDIDKAYHELLKEINILEREPQWVPAVWLHDEINP